MHPERYDITISLQIIRRYQIARAFMDVRIVQYSAQEYLSPDKEIFLKIWVILDWLTTRNLCWVWPPWWLMSGSAWSTWMTCLPQPLSASHYRQNINLVRCFLQVTTADNNSMTTRLLRPLFCLVHQLGLFWWWAEWIYWYSFLSWRFSINHYEARSVMKLYAVARKTSLTTSTRTIINNNNTILS